jgi:hypothetical protein
LRFFLYYNIAVKLMESVTKFPRHIPLHIPFPDIRPFVKGFLAFADTQLNLDPALFEVK